MVVMVLITCKTLVMCIARANSFLPFPEAGRPLLLLSKRLAEPDY